MLFVVSVFLGSICWYLFLALRGVKERTKSNAEAMAQLRMELHDLRKSLQRRIQQLENASRPAETLAQPAPAMAERSVPVVEMPVAAAVSVFEQEIIATPSEEIISEPVELMLPEERPPLPLAEALPAAPAQAPSGWDASARQAAIEQDGSVTASMQPEPTFEPATGGPSLGERVKTALGSEEIEALVGGSWLNKVGVFVLVIGIALFLGYSFTQFGPAGRVAIGLGISTAMLVGGVWIERQERYRIFSRGLIGGGWAALFFTTYAMHSVEAAKVIDSAVAGTILLFAVSSGMIAHSLRYRSQTVTGLAYFLGFVTLMTAETTPLSVVALVPLAASLLYVAHHFRWSHLSLFGLLATYGVCASRGNTGSPVWQAQTVFCIYWLLFEVFDLLRASRKPGPEAEEDITVESALLPLNALGLSFLSWAKWSAAAPDSLYLLAAGIAGAHLAGTLLRARLRPPSSFSDDTGALARACSGGYEGPITLAAAFGAVSVLLRFDGVATTAGLLVEAELFFLAGIVFKQRYLRHLGGVLFGATFAKLAGVDVPEGRLADTARWSIHTWTPVAILAAALCYLNRKLHESGKLYGYAASAALALVIGAEAPLRYLGPAWFLFAGALFVFGWVARLREFRIQGYAVSVLALGSTMFRQISIAQGLVEPSQYAWIALLGGAILSYGAAMCGLWSPEDRLTSVERAELPRLASWAVTAHLATLVWRLAPDFCTGLGWLILALLLFDLGLRELPREFRMQGYVMAGLGSVATLVEVVLPIRNDGLLMERLPAILAAVALYLFAARAFSARKSAGLEQETLAAVTFASAMATCFLMAGIWAVAPPVLVAPIWALLAILLAEVGFAFDLPALRAQANIALMAAGVRLFLANFSLESTSGVVSTRLLTVIPVVASYYYLWSRLKNEMPRLGEREQRLGRWYLHAAAGLVVVLLRFEMGRVPVALAWALFALVLLVIGIRRNKVDLRVESAVIALLAFWRGFTTDFYAPESFAGLAGRIATAATVIGCFYASQLLTPRQYEQRPGLERYSRTFYSLLATVLLTLHLFREVSGSLLTLAWGAEGAMLLAAGFPLRERALRLSALALLLVCVLKLFLFDLRQLETMYRILSFIVLGLILVAASWIYTRFRERVHRYL